MRFRFLFAASEAAESSREEALRSAETEMGGAGATGAGAGAGAITGAGAGAGFTASGVTIEPPKPLPHVTCCVAAAGFAAPQMEQMPAEYGFRVSQVAQTHIRGAPQVQTEVVS